MILSGPFLVPVWQDVVASNGTGNITKRASLIGRSGIPRNVCFILFIGNEYNRYYMIKTAAAMTEVHKPFLSPMADCVMFAVLTILLDIFHISFFSS